MAHTGRVLLVPRTREGWDEVVEDTVPCVIGKYVFQSGKYEPYYEVDSPYLLIKYPCLAVKLGWRWEWPADDRRDGRARRA